jgi:hypothetical protein
VLQEAALRYSDCNSEDDGEYRLAWDNLRKAASRYRPCSCKQRDPRAHRPHFRRARTQYLQLELW